MGGGRSEVATTATAKSRIFIEQLVCLRLVLATMCTSSREAARSFFPSCLIRMVGTSPGFLVVCLMFIIRAYVFRIVGSELEWWRYRSKEFDELKMEFRLN